MAVTSLQQPDLMLVSTLHGLWIWFKAYSTYQDIQSNAGHGGKIDPLSMQFVESLLLPAGI